MTFSLFWLLAGVVTASLLFRKEKETFKRHTTFAKIILVGFVLVVWPLFIPSLGED